MTRVHLKLHSNVLGSAVLVHAQLRLLCSHLKKHTEIVNRPGFVSNRLNTAYVEVRSDSGLLSSERFFRSVQKHDVLFV